MQKINLLLSLFLCLLTITAFFLSPAFASDNSSFFGEYYISLKCGEEAKEKSYKVSSGFSFWIGDDYSSRGTDQYLYLSDDKKNTTYTYEDKYQIVNISVSVSNNKIIVYEDGQSLESPYNSWEAEKEFTFLSDYNTFTVQAYSYSDYRGMWCYGSGNQGTGERRGVVDDNDDNKNTDDNNNENDDGGGGGGGGCFINSLY